MMFIFKMRTILFILLFTSSFTFVKAQEPETDLPSKAKKQFAEKNYKPALRTYLELIKANPDNAEYNLNAGLCYLRTNVNKEEAFKYFEKYLTQPKADMERLMDLGNAYRFANKFDLAIETYNKYIATFPKKTREIEEANHQIEACNNAKEIMKNPLKVKFENLGKKVNSEYADYYPFLPSNESFIVYTTRRPGNTGGIIDPDGYYTSEMFISEWKNASWTKAKGIGAKLNTEYDEEVVGLSPDGKQLLVYIDHEDTYGDIYISNWEKSSFGMAVDLGQVINTNKVESAASIGLNGTTLVYASFKSGGKGSSDLWMSKKLPDGKWGTPTNIEELNTPYGEDFPHLSEDKSTLYFASEGHNSMGGFDIFKSDWDEQNMVWKKPVNVGYPINTTDDNMTICYMENGRSAYTSQILPDGYGDLDIYRVVFEDVEAKLSVITANVIASADTGKNGVNAEILINYLPTGNKQGEYKTLRDGRTAIALDAGKYEVLISCSGYKPFKKEITVDNRKNYTEVIPMSFNLEPEFVKKVEDPKTKGKPTDVKATSGVKNKVPVKTAPEPTKK